jgi:hypothetical protein
MAQTTKDKRTEAYNGLVRGDNDHTQRHSQPIRTEGDQNLYIDSRKLRGAIATKVMGGHQYNLVDGIKYVGLTDNGISTGGAIIFQNCDRQGRSVPTLYAVRNGFGITPQQIVDSYKTSEFTKKISSKQVPDCPVTDTGVKLEIPYFWFNPNPTPVRETETKRGLWDRLLGR